jgi:hypothetical protein
MKLREPLSAEVEGGMKEVEGGMTEVEGGRLNNNIAGE